MCTPVAEHNSDAQSPSTTSQDVFTLLAATCALGQGTVGNRAGNHISRPPQALGTGIVSQSSMALGIILKLLSKEPRLGNIGEFTHIGSQVAESGCNPGSNED